MQVTCLPGLCCFINKISTYGRSLKLQCHSQSNPSSVLHSPFNIIMNCLDISTGPNILGMLKMHLWKTMQFTSILKNYFCWFQNHSVPQILVILTLSCNFICVLLCAPLLCLLAIEQLSSLKSKAIHHQLIHNWTTAEVFWSHFCAKKNIYYGFRSWGLTLNR